MNTATLPKPHRTTRETPRPGAHQGPPCPNAGRCVQHQLARGRRRVRLTRRSR